MSQNRQQKLKHWQWPVDILWHIKFVS